MVVVGAIPGLQSGGAAERGMAETRQTRQPGTRQRLQTIQDEKDKKDNLKQDEDELELCLWMLQLHAEGAGNSVRAGVCDIHSVVGYYAMLCYLSSTQKCVNIQTPLEKGVRKRLCRVLSIVYSMLICQKMKKVTNLSE